jgi:hypothetical protein
MESAKGGVRLGAETFIQAGNGDGQHVAGETEGPPHDISKICTPS